MNAETLRSLQAPLKEKYRQEPNAALVTLRAEGRLGGGITCKIETGKAPVTAGLHPATGGDGLSACSGDMLLEALVGCAGVTLNAVATALGIRLRDAKVRAESLPTKLRRPTRMTPRWRANTAFIIISTGSTSAPGRSSAFVRRRTQRPPCTSTAKRTVRSRKKLFRLNLTWPICFLAAAK